MDIARPRRIMAERRARDRSASGVRRGGRTICLSGVMMKSVVPKIEVRCEMRVEMRDEMRDEMSWVE